MKLYKKVILSDHQFCNDAELNELAYKMATMKVDVIGQMKINNKIYYMARKRGLIAAITRLLWLFLYKANL